MKTTPVDLARHRREVRGARPRHRQDRHHRHDAGRGVAGLAPGQRRQGARRSRSPWARSASSRGSSGPSSAPRSPIAGFNPERVFAAGMLPFPVLKNDFAYDQINANTEVYGVHRRPDRAEPQPGGAQRGVPPPRAEQGHGAVPGPQRRTRRPSSRSCMWLDIKGCSVTIPHKEADRAAARSRRKAPSSARARATRSSSRSRGAGSATTPITAPRWIRSRRPWAGRASEEDASPLFEKQVLILGAGGVARSIAFGLARRGANVTITNRHDERATRLAEEVGCRAVTWSAQGEHAGRRDHQLHARRDAPRRRRHAAASGGVQPGGDGRVRHDLSPREHDAAQAGAGAGLPRRSRAWTCSSARRRSSSSSTPGRTPPVDVMREALNRKLSPLRDE